MTPSDAPVRPLPNRRRTDRRQPWWHLSLLERFSIGAQVAGFVVALAIVVVGLSYRAYVDAAQELIRQAEGESLSGAAHVAQARIEAESRVLSGVSAALARHPAVQDALQARSEAGLATARLEFDKAFDSAGFSMLHLIDRTRSIRHRASEPGVPTAKANFWGIGEALAGDTLLQTSKEPGGGLVIRAMVPVHGADDEVVGVVMAGTRFDDKFAQRIGKDSGVELAFATPTGVVARSSERFVQAPEAHRAFIEAALFQRRPVLDFDLDHAALRQYVPLRLGDETFVLIVQGDAAAAQARVVGAARQTLQTSAAVLVLAIVASCLFALTLASRLRRVGAQARTLARDITGNDVMQAAAGEQAQPVRRSELAVLEHVFDRTALAVARHHEELHEAKARAEHAANFDGLTGLMNRACLMQRVAAIMADRADAEWALLFLDLDGFKQVNDLHGHDAGDALLRLTASRLREQVNQGDDVARLGGDEFVILVHRQLDPVAPDLSASLVDQARRLATSLIVALEQPVATHDGRVLLVSASIGIALHPAHGQESPLLFKRADIALYASKHAGRRTYRFYGHPGDADAKGLTLVA